MRFLIVKASSLGDIIHAFSALAFLKNAFPDAQIDWVVEKRFAEIIEAHPDIDRAICMDSKRWRRAQLGSFGAFRRALRKYEYDYVFDLQGNIKSAVATFLARSKHKIGFGRKTVSEWPNLLVTNWRVNPPPGKNIRDDYLALVKRPFDEIAYEPRAVVLQANETLDTNANVMVCPGAAWTSKCLSTETLIDFCQRLQRAYHYRFLWVWGTSEERVICQSLKSHIPDSTIATKLSLPALQNLMAKMELVIAMDSLPLHLAGLTGTRTFSIFGPSSENKYRPPGNHQSIQGPCPFNVTFEKRCPRLRRCPAPCIKALTGSELFQAIHPPPKTESSS